MAVAEIFFLLKGTISLIPGITKVIGNIRKSGKEPTLNRIVDSLAEDTIEASDELIKKINEIKRILKDNDFDLKLRIGERQESLSSMTLIKNYSLSRATKKLRAIQDNLTSSIEEIGRILMCTGSFKDMAEFDEFVRNMTRDLNGIEEKSIDEIFVAYTEILLDLKEKLKRK
jgi:hypothetical protein